MTGDGRGVLYPAGLPRLSRLPAPEHVRELARWFWIPEWDLAPGRTSRQELIAFPACNLVVEHEVVGLAGPTTRRSFRDLSGRGWAVGALLRPAAVPHLTPDPSDLRDQYRVLDLPGLLSAVAAVMTGDGDAGGRRVRAVGVFADWLAAHLPAPDAASRLGVSTRTLQRVARRHVGLSPAAMIRRRRLQEAAERLRHSPGTDIAGIAADLGYTDHAHLARDFREVLGFTPSAYRSVTSPR